MKSYKQTNLLLFAIVVLCPFLSVAKAFCGDFDPLKYLRDNYPKLTNEYEYELMNFPVHYIFAVDVSGTMNKYDKQVDSALVPFIQALPDNDYVTFIRFGTEAKDNEVGYNAKISTESKNTLINNIHQLYTNVNDERSFRQHTDIYKAIKAISDVEKRRQEVKQNVVVVITDFRNEAADGVERKLSEEQLNQLNRMIEAANVGKESRNIALKLDVNEAAQGYCLEQLRDNVFPTEGKAAMQVVPVGNDPTAINSWFEQLRRDIMVNKLTTIIEMENRAIDICFEQNVNIDGDVDTKIKWAPTRLYKKMKIDSSIVASPAHSGFYFDVNADELGEKKEFELEVELGQLKHSGFGFLGFHHMADSLQLGVDMPTDFDVELQKLGIQKPISTPKNMVDKWIFTLPIPFWLAATIVALILIYILLVLRQIKRNMSNLGCFKGEIQIFDSQDDMADAVREVVSTYKPEVVIGKTGKNRLRVNAQWTVTLRKVTYSPFWPFHDPELRIFTESGFVWTNLIKNGVNDKKCPGRISLSCSEKRGMGATHSVTIMLKG